MAEKPLLIFPTRTRIGFQKGNGGEEKDLSKPNKSFQNSRIEVLYKKISAALENRRFEIQQNADNAPPEMVLVFETRGSIKDFFIVINHVPDFKYLGEYEDYFDPTPEFYYETNKEKKVPGKLFFILTNDDALKQMRSLWGVWKSKKHEFKRGTARWGPLFNLLVDIRPWSVKDRIEETGIINDWRQRVELNQEVIPFELEMWFRKSSGQRQIIKDRIINYLNQSHARLLQECIIEEIGYHGMLVEAPISIFSSLLNENDVQLFKANDVMFFKPVGQSILRHDAVNEVITDNSIIPPFVEEYSPILCLLDGLPLQNHRMLSNRIIVHDPDNMENNYPAAQRNHGTNMASILIHGDLNEGNIPLKSKILIRPVMRYKPFPGGGGEETLVENGLIVDLFHRAVKEILEGNKTIPATMPTIKVFNISLGDINAVFHNTISAWARLLDWLSEKYNILFVISSGNVTEDILFENLNQSFDELLANQDALNRKGINILFSKNRFRKLISPAESINALTVGSSNDDASGEIDFRQRIQLFSDKNMISPISRMGLGFKNSIKPDVLAKGGRVLFRRLNNNELRLLPQDSIKPGVKVATSGSTGGVNNTSFTKGTSNSAAITTNSIGKLYENFRSEPELLQKLTGEYFPVTAKALIVHSAALDLQVSEYIKSSIDVDINKRDLVNRFLGYGIIDLEKVVQCTSSRVTILGYGKIHPEEGMLFEFPLPDSLSGTGFWRKITLTLSWFTPIKPENQLYKTCKLWFDFPEKDIEEKLQIQRQLFDNDTVKRGTVQHEVFFGTRVSVFPENSSLKIRVNCTADKTKVNQFDSIISKSKSIRFSLTCSIEVDPQIGVDIYNEILIKVRQRVQAQQRV